MKMDELSGEVFQLAATAVDKALESYRRSVVTTLRMTARAEVFRRRTAEAAALARFADALEKSELRPTASYVKEGSQ